MTSSTLPVVAILGGTGELGTGLARRWALAGYPIIIGSRDRQKAQAAAEELQTKMSAAGQCPASVDALDNLNAAKAADIVALTVPFSHQKNTLEAVKKALEGKILIDVTVPLVPPKVARVQLPAEGSAGQIAQALLGDNCRVVSAFQNVAASHLQQERDIDCDVLVCGNDKDARSQVIELVEAAGLRGFHAGGIHNAAAAEALTSVLISINRQFKCHAGIRVTGLPE
ncbi:NADPH-dependent F420 reductase [Pseudomaricurvus alkylphenolicus]|jgi:NADPH-dependent F420 reductase|uniref:NADPH-dependent F420 reductase n=1 Tax=Pseudomaricurvus alkylphenolicus TaxID=1306991 RepID=UPI001422BB9E|nr:NADPH-dependent F420 reductase [Pseudomaricurvus alkylphenolicus]NIB37959.1 NADPH-dependent F420 reductase [Pseudomaricurvus alkylphenolicus]